MGQRHHEPLNEAPVEMPSERSTGLVFAGVCVIAAVLLRSHLAIAVLLLCGAAVFLGFALFLPKALKRLNSAWFSFALALNKFVSPVIMLVLYGLVIVPCGLLMQTMRDPMQRKRVAVSSTYWIRRDRELNKSTMSDQF